MSLHDFAEKQYHIATTQGLGSAVRAGAGEAGMKGLSVFSPLFETSIWEFEWDVCLVLDSCRADLFQEVSSEYDWLPDEIGTQWSVGSASPEWISKTFDPNHHLENVAYVTANPFSGKTGDESPVMNPEVFPLASGPLRYLDEVWRDQWPVSDDLPTVSPSVLTERAMWAHERLESDQRLVVHYMQPHLPFKTRPEWCAGWELEGFGTGGGKGKNDWIKVRDGDLERTEFWAAYRDNLRWVLDDIGRWIHETDSRILITSDHGNGMGEWGVWGHPPGIGAPAVRRVPWVILEGSGERDRPTPDPPGNPPVTAFSNAKDEIDERLEALGYR